MLYFFTRNIQPDHFYKKNRPLIKAVSFLRAVISVMCLLALFILHSIPPVSEAPDRQSG